MKKLWSHFIFTIRISILLLLIILMSTCKKEEIVLNATLTIKTISATPQVIAVNGQTQLSCELEMTGIDNIKDIEYSWTCENGTIKSSSNNSTYWTPKPGEIGTYTISLKVSYNDNEVRANTFIKVVKTPADGWGSVSGYIYDSKGAAIANTDVVTVTGESTKTSDIGFFFIPDIPKGTTSLNFPVIKFAWASDFPQAVQVQSGSHVHLGSILLYESIAPKMVSATPIHGRRMLIAWEYIDPTLYQYIDIYQSGTKIKRLSNSETSILLTSSSTGYATFTAKAIPFYGQTSSLSNSVSGSFVGAIDPTGSNSYFEYYSFYSARLYWKAPIYDSYLSGYRLGELGSYYWNWITSLLPLNPTQYPFSTYPGQTGIYFVISIADDGSYNDSQPGSQRISMSVPALATPANFIGQFNSGMLTNALSWGIIVNNPDWYNGYIIKMATGVTPADASFKHVFKTTNMATATFSQSNIALHTQYNYRLYSYSIRPSTTDTTFSKYAEKVIIVP